MKKLLALLLAVMLAVPMCAWAQPEHSTLGYTIDLPDGMFFVGPDTIDRLAAAAAPGVDVEAAMEQLGIGKAYMADYEKRDFEMIYPDQLNDYGNVVVRRMVTDSSGVTLNDYLAAVEAEILPQYEALGAEVVMKPQLRTLNGHVYASFGIIILDRAMSQHMTVNEENGQWYNFTFTRFDDQTIDAMLGSVVFD